MVFENISSFGIGVVCFQVAFFVAMILMGVTQKILTRSLRRTLSECLKNSKDFFGEISTSNALAISCRARYRNAAERIESVDAHLIVNSEMSRYPLFKFFFFRLTFTQSDELLAGASGFLVTIGLVGTFVGLIQNLAGLSALISPESGLSAPASLMDGFAAVFPLMGAAFMTSLFGISLGSFFWLFTSLAGISSLSDELNELLCGYLEQVVQADCRCYSLVGESMERMQLYLDNYLSNFSQSVGSQIQTSIDQSIGKLVLSLSGQVDQIHNFVSAVSSGCSDLERAGELFAKATFQLQRSDFASEFSDACSNFIDHTKLLAQTTENVRVASSDLVQQAADLAIHISRSSDIHQDLSDVLAQSANALDASQKTALSTSERLNTAVDAMERVNKRGMTWLSMRAKTDSKLVELTDQLQQMLLKFSSVADKISASTYSDLSALRADLNELKGISSALLEGARRSESEMQLVKAGLEQMADAPMRLAA